LEHWLGALDELARVPLTPELASKAALGQIMGLGLSGIGSAQSIEAADRAMETLRRYGSNEDRALAGTMASWFYILAGRTERVRTVRRIARELATDGPDPLAKIVYLHSEAALALTRGQVHAASDAAEQGLKLATESGIDAWSYHLFAAAAMSAIGRRDLAAAERWLDAMTAGSSMNSDFARGYQGYVRGWLCLQQGDLPAAIYWNDDSLRTAERIGFRPGWYLSLAAAVIHRAASGERVDAAVDQLDEWLRRTPSPFMKTQGEVAKVYAQLCRGGVPKENLRDVLRQARRVGYGAFLAPRVIFQLACAALDYGIECDYAIELLRSHDLGPVPEVYGIAAWPWPVRVRVLGGLHIELEGQPAKFGRKAPSALLMLLQVLATSDGPITTQRLSTALWSGSAASAPRGSLDTALYRLRKLLGTEAAVLSESSNVSLDPNVCWTDTRAFALCCAGISALAESPDEPLELAGVDHQEQKLLDLYRGPLAEDGAPRILLQQRAKLARRFERAAAELDGLWQRLGAEERRTRLREAVAQRSAGAPVRALA
jgi:hypothetical protein